MNIVKRHPAAWNAFHNFLSGDVDVVLEAAPGTSKRLYITGFMVSNGASAVKITFTQDPAGTPVEIAPDLHFAANGGCAPVAFPEAVPLPENTALGITTVGDGLHGVMVFGYTE